MATIKQIGNLLDKSFSKWDYNKAVKLTRERCDEMLNDFLAGGVTANRMRAVPDVGQPYKTPDV